MFFIIYQTMHSFLDKCNPLPTKFRKGSLYNSENNNVSIVILNAYVAIYCENVTSNNSTHSILIVSEINKSH